jgi:predicted ATP-grasp superfamily ATP-dependent carboligase
MIHKLVILGSTLTGLAVARDAHAHGLDAYVIDTDRNGIAFTSRKVRPIVVAPADETSLLGAIAAQGGHGVGLIATGDHWLARIRLGWGTLQSAFERVFHPGPEAISTCLSKASFAAWCRNNELPAPTAWLVDEEPRPADLRAPLLLRPVETLHARPDAGLPKAVQAQTDAEFEWWRKEFRAKGCRLLATESLLGQRLTQYSVPFARAGGQMLSFVARKIRPLPERLAVGTCVELAPEANVEDLGRRAAERLDYYGVGEAEILHSHDSGRNYLIEVNARPWLQYPLAPASGHDFLGLLLDPSTVRMQGMRKRGYTWVDFSSDLYTSFAREHGVVRTGAQTVATYLGSLLRANVFARFDLGDPAPALQNIRPAWLRGGHQ